MDTAKLVAALMCALFAGSACSHASASLMVDAPKLMSYQKPDIDEITGIDSSDQPEEPGPGSAQNPQQRPRK
jgi:hypothetical protein